MKQLKKIGIIGGGFSGTITAVNLIDKSQKPLEIFLINKKSNLTKGVAYNTYTEKHLLNVIAGKMSAHNKIPNHFLDWVMLQAEFKNKDREIITASFLSRSLYSEYLAELWKQGIITALGKGIKITLIDSKAIDLELEKNKANILLENGQSIAVDDCVIATGNNLPRNPKIKNTDFYTNANYFQNPWKAEAIKNADNSLPVLIIGNGLTMVDTVLGLLETGFKGHIYAISPNGFNILPHRHTGMLYEKLKDDLRDDLSLLDLVKLINKHVKSLRAYGISAEPVIDALKPYVQGIWKKLSLRERELFMARLRHLWGVARHRLPLTVHDKIQQLRIEGQLHIKSGKIIDFTAIENAIKVVYFDKKEGIEKALVVGRIINCTGPETDIEKLHNSFLKNCLLKGIISQDALKLGINANTDTFQVLDAQGNTHNNVYAIGSNLKGMLWESTAVNELRFQAEKLSEDLLVKHGLG